MVLASASLLGVYDVIADQEDARKQSRRDGEVLVVPKVLQRLSVCLYLLLRVLEYVVDECACCWVRESAAHVVGPNQSAHNQFLIL